MATRGKSAITAARGIRLDLGCGRFKHELAVGIDKVPADGVDLVYDLTNLDWPVPTGSAHTVYAISLWQELPREYIRNFMDELWRVCRHGTEIFLAGYYGHDWRYLGNPLCVNPMVETTLMHWDPRTEWYQVFQPASTFHLKMFERVPAARGADYNAVLSCVKEGK